MHKTFDELVFFPLATVEADATLVRDAEDGQTQSVFPTHLACLVVRGPGATNRENENTG